MEANHPGACVLSPGIVDDMCFGWSQHEENELFEGLLYHVDRMQIHDADMFHEMIVHVAEFLTFTLLDKANVDLIRWKLRHLADTYRQFKLFLFLKPGVQFNISTNTAKVGPKYWRCTNQESETDAYFRTHGFRLYNECWYVFDSKGLEQYASYIDEAVHATIPFGVEPPCTDEFYYFRGRGRIQRYKQTERNMRYKDGEVNNDKVDVYFFTNGWDPVEEVDFIDRVVDMCKHRNIQNQEKYDILVQDLVNFYDDPKDMQVSEVGIREKLRSLAYVYQLFKRFIFDTVGVEYNFYSYYAKVDDTYWETEGKEPQYKGWFRCNGYTLYQDCYTLFDVKGLDRFAYGKHPPIDHTKIPPGVDLSDMLEKDMYKSYYRS